MSEIIRVLTRHFFRRFFDNDTLHTQGDTLTTVVRAIAIVAAPGLMVAFFIQNQYFRAPLWVRIQTHYLFVLLSFVVMGAVAIFEWEMLFPDRIDFLVLSPLSIKPSQMLIAKAAALTGFLILFLVSCNLFGTLMLPMLIFKGDFLRQFIAHAAAVFLAGIFAAFFFLALGGVLLCLLDAARFRIVSPLLQMLSIAALALLTVHFARFGDSLQGLLTPPRGNARWIPTFWFLGLYEQLLQGPEAPPFAHEMANYALRSTAIVAAITLLTYPLAWTRMRKMAIEGASQKRKPSAPWLTAILHRLIRRPGERAAFHFISQTIRRNNRYQVYLAVYGGSGLALAIACATTVRTVGTVAYPALSTQGLHAVLPLLLFWLIAGLRTAFAFPIALSAGWIFRITGVSIDECADAARRWVLLCALTTVACILAALIAAHWSPRQLLVQIVSGVCLSFLLTDSFFFSQQTVPFNQPRMPGKTNFPLMLTLYVGVLTPYIYSIIYLENGLEKHPLKLLLPIAATAAIHALIRHTRTPAEIEEEMEGYEGEFQLLGLS